MIRIAICDDEQGARESLTFALERVIDEDRDKIVYDFSSGDNAVNWLKKHPGEVDLLFLDVEMKGLNGMEAAKEIRSFDSKLIIVFVTGYTDYVFDGYQVQALDYILKPANESRLRDVLGRVHRQICQTEKEQFTFQNAEGTYRIYHSDILYCYSERRLVTIVTKEKGLSFYAKLDQVAQQLGSKFIRIHQRYLVNASAVSRIQSDSVSIGEITLPISRSLKSDATTALAKSMLGGL